ncbi:MAG: ABC transporter substrate-binding protein [Acidimicrobiia bacterium]
MRKHLWVRLFAVVAVIGLVAAACDSDSDDDSGDDSSTTEAPDDTGGGETGALTYGKLLPETGDLSAIIGALSTPVDIATEEINAAGGVNGEDVEVISQDSGTDPDIASAAADQLLADDVDVIIGAAASGVSLAIVDKVTSEGVVMCSGSNTSAELTDVDDNGGFYFRTAPPDKLQGPAMSELLASDGITNIVIIARNDSYGVGFSDAITDSFEAAGGTVTDQIAYDPEGTNFDAEATQVTEAISNGAEAVVLIGFNDDGGLVEQALIQAGAGPADIPTYMADGSKGSSFFEAVDPNNPAVLVGVRGTAPAAAPAGADHPFEAVYAETGEDTIFSSYFYDCVILTALAAQSAGSNDPSAIKDAIPDVLTGDNACKEFAECKQFLEDGETINYDGASGPLDFSDVGEPQRGAYDVWMYDDTGADVNVEGVDQIVIDESGGDE